MKGKLAVLVACLGLLGSGAGLVAHHSFSAEYDGTKTFKLTGVVSKVEWTNPHVRFYVDVVEARQDRDVEHGAGQPERARAQRVDEPHVEGRRQGDGRRLRRQGRAEPRQRTIRDHGRRPLAVRRRRGRQRTRRARRRQSVIGRITCERCSSSRGSSALTHAADGAGQWRSGGARSWQPAATRSGQRARPGSQASAGADRSGAAAAGRHRRSRTASGSAADR